MSAKRNAYVEKLKAQLDAFNAELDELEAEARKADAESRIRYEDHLKSLREKQAGAKKALAGISDAKDDAKDDAWSDLAQGLELTWSSLKSSFIKAKSEFEKGYREGMEE